MKSLLQSSIFVVNILGMRNQLLLVVYRKERVKSIEDAKKEIFQEVRREIPSDGWVEEVISEIQASLARYK